MRVATPDGEYSLGCDWLIVCDGARSPVRQMLGLEAEGQVFRDRFLIADIHMKSDFPTERWFWFDPPFHPNQSALLHRQADDVWRIDFQLGWDADPDDEKKPERVLPRLRAMLGDAADFDIEWASVYTFQCRRMQRFRHGRVIFAGDAAHVVSPFGARGANSGIQDTDNLVWKLELVMGARAPERLLDTYDAERTYAADENILNSTRSTDFITPKSRVSRTFRDAVLSLAKDHPFARRLVNSGRLSVPAILADSPLNTPDRDPDFARGPAAMIPGAPAADAPVAGPAGDWLLGIPRRRLHAAGVRRRGRSLRRRRARARAHPLPGRPGRRQGDRGRRAGRGRRRISRSSATMRGRAPSTCCARTSTSARAGANSTCRACARRSRARRATHEMNDPRAHFVRRSRIPLRGTSLRLSCGLRPGVRLALRGRRAPFGRPGGR